MSLYQKEKLWKRINSSRIDQQNNRYRIEEIVQHYNKFEALVNKYTREAKEKYALGK